MTSTNGLGYCPCGSSKAATCNACGRLLCAWHHALGPFADGGGGVELAPVCLPECSAPWWRELDQQHERGHAARREEAT